MSFFSARRYGESILTLPLRGLNNTIPFAGCTVNGLNRWLNWSGGTRVDTVVQDSISLFNKFTLGKLFICTASADLSDAEQKHPEKRNPAECLGRWFWSHDAKQKVGRGLVKSRSVGCLQEFNSQSIVFDRKLFLFLVVVVAWFLS